jgi:hypothetical protein
LAFSARHQSLSPALIAATVRRLQCRASAVTTLPFDRDQAKHLKRRFQIAAIIGGHRGQRQAQMRGIGRDHHPGPRALARILALVARAPQRLAVDGDHVTIAEQHRDLRQNPTEGRIQRLRVDHPKHHTDRYHAMGWNA